MAWFVVCLRALGAWLVVSLGALGACSEGSLEVDGLVDAGQARDSGEGEVGEVEVGAADAGERDLGVEPEPEPEPGEPEACEVGVRCGAECVDLSADPLNCGLCSRTCVVASAQASCEGGECAVGRCQAGFLDVDGAVANGCEVEDNCEAGAACEASCGSAGAMACEGGAGRCVPPGEACNGVDDNCDGACDEGGLGGCRAGVHRSHGNGHLYTTDLGAASRSPFRLESQDYFFIYAQPVPGTRPLFLCRKGDGKRFLTSDTACEMAGGVEAQLGFWAPEGSCGAVPLYRLYHEPTSNHFYTLSAPERDNARDNLGYRDEGIGGYVWRER